MTHISTESIRMLHTEYKTQSGSTQLTYDKLFSRDFNNWVNDTYGFKINMFTNTILLNDPKKKLLFDIKYPL